MKERLTNQINNTTFDGELFAKLKALEDIEQAIGIEIADLWKAMQDGIFIDHYGNGEPWHMRMPLLHSDYDSRRACPVRVWLEYKKDGWWNKIRPEDLGKKWFLSEEDFWKAKEEEARARIADLEGKAKKDG